MQELGVPLHRLRRGGRRELLRRRLLRGRAAAPDRSGRLRLPVAHGRRVRVRRTGRALCRLGALLPPPPRHRPHPADSVPDLTDQALDLMEKLSNQGLPGFHLLLGFFFVSSLMDTTGGSAKSIGKCTTTANIVQ